MMIGDYYSHLDLSRNNLGNDGVGILIKSLRANCSLIHLDVGSNDLSYEGAQELFRNI